MLVHLVPYERLYLAITLDLDEATAILDALALIKVNNKGKEVDAAVSNLQRLLEEGSLKANRYAAKGQGGK